MDALLAYGSNSSDEGELSEDTTTIDSKKSLKNAQTNFRGDCSTLQNVDKNTSSNIDKYDYNRLNFSVLPYNNHQQWIPSALMGNFNQTRGTTPNIIGPANEVGPQLKIPVECEKYTPEVEKPVIINTTPGPTKTSDSTTSKRTNFKVRPYVSKRERAKRLENNSNPSSSTTKNDKVNYDSVALEDSKSPSVINKPPRKVYFNFTAHSKCVNCVRWNPIKQNILASASMDHTVGLWDTNKKGLCLSRLTIHQAAVKDMKWSPCGTNVLSCGFDKCAKLVDVTTGKLIQDFAHKQYVTCVQFHPSNPNLFLSGTSRNGIHCWDIRKQEVISTYQSPFGQVQDLVFLPGGEEFISAAEVLRRNSTDKGIMVWDFRTTAIMSNQIYQEAFTCTCLKVHPSGTYFGAQSNADYIALFSTKRPYKLNKYKRFEGHQVSAYVIGFDFSPDGSLAVTGSADGKTYIYDSLSSRLITTIPSHSSVCMGTSFHPSSPSIVATCSFDGQISILM